MFMLQEPRSQLVSLLLRHLIVQPTMILDLTITSDIESARLDQETHYAYITFVQTGAAAALVDYGERSRQRIKNQVLSFSLVPSEHIAPEISEAIKRAGVTRSIVVGEWTPVISSGETIEADFAAFGQVEQFKMDVEKGAAFIHFTIIDSAIRAKACPSADPRYLDLQICFAKDRCAKFGVIRMKAYTGLTVSAVESMLEDAVLQDVLTVEGRRKVYLDNISPDTTTDKICNVTRGGMLSHIHRQPQSTSATVAFVDPDAAAQFVDYATTHGVKIMERRVEVRWNDDCSHTLSPDVIHALRRGATRELFGSNVPGYRGMGTDKLLHDFSMSGTVERVRWYWHRNFAFVSFTNIASATAAIQVIKEAKSEYAFNRCRIDYAFQDRCARPLTSNMDTSTHKVRSEVHRAARRAYRARRKSLKRAAREAAEAAKQAETAGWLIGVQDAQTIDTNDATIMITKAAESMDVQGMAVNEAEAALLTAMETDNTA